MDLANLTLAKVDIDRAADASILGENEQLAYAEGFKAKTSSALAEALLSAAPDDSPAYIETAPTKARTCTQAVGAELAARLAKLERSAQKEEESSMEQLLATQGKAMCPELTKDLLSLTNKLKILTAEMHPAAPRDMESGYEIKDSAFQGETRVYRLPFEPGSVGFKVVLQAVEGDPDLYVCQTHQKPSMSHHTWRSASEGIDMVHVQQGDPKFKESCLFIGIHGHSKCHFRLKASWSENRNQLRGTDALEFRKTTAARLSEKILNFREAESRRNRTVTAENAERLGSKGAKRARSKLQPARSAMAADLDSYSVKRKLLQDLAALRKRTTDSVKIVNARKLWESDACPSAEVQRAFWVGAGDFKVGKPKHQHGRSGAGSGDIPGVLRFGQRTLRERPQARRLASRKETSSLSTRTLQQAHLETTMRMRRQEERLHEAFVRAAPVTELGGLALEAPVRSADKGTRVAFARGLAAAVEARPGAHSHTLGMENVGLAKAQADQDRQVVSTARVFASFRR